MNANLYALVPLESAARELGLDPFALRALLLSDDIDAHVYVSDQQCMVYRHSIEKLKARTVQFGNPPRMDLGTSLSTKGESNVNE